jgi:hypothetical protein
MPQTAAFARPFVALAMGTGMAASNRRPQVFEKSGFPCFSKTLAL